MLRPRGAPVCAVGVACVLQRVLLLRPRRCRWRVAQPRHRRRPVRALRRTSGTYQSHKTRPHGWEELGALAITESYCSGIAPGEPPPPSCGHTFGATERLTEAVHAVWGCCWPVTTRGNRPHPFPPLQPRRQCLRRRAHFCHSSPTKTRRESIEGGLMVPCANMSALIVMGQDVHAHGPQLV